MQNGIGHVKGKNVVLEASKGLPAGFRVNTLSKEEQQLKGTNIICH